MNAEIGHLALNLTGGIAFLQFLFPVLTPYPENIAPLVKRLALAQALLLTLSLCALGYAFLYNDFSLHYVASHSNSLLPWYYRLSAIWGGHEGSLLLWLYILSLWSAAVSLRSHQLPDAFLARVLAVLGYIAFGFVLFISLTSNPFARQIPFPFDGQDLNPLLQDPGLIFHPPMLYAGYVGFAVAFAFVVAGLWQGRLDSLWLKRARPWTLAAWLTLTLGIALGSYWAYYELGWGGWWFWDPVENASLMPWLIGTALIHSLAVSEKRGLFMIWTALLAILAFSLSLVGTFLVRSGVLTSVHAFASDPTRGIFILGLLTAILLPALLLLILRASSLSRPSPYALLSRESGILLNSWLFSGAWLIVLVGTLYPLIADILSLGKISVGAPYFNRLIIPLALISLIALGIGPLLQWRRHKLTDLKPKLYTLFILTLTISVWLLMFYAPKHGINPQTHPQTKGYHLATLIATLATSFALSGILTDYLFRFKHRGMRALNTRAADTGMIISHLGYILMAYAIIATGYYSNEQDLSIQSGGNVQIANYDIHLQGFEQHTGANYQATQGKFLIRKTDDPSFFSVLTPAKRTYFSATMPMTESARLVTPTHDLYLAMGEALDNDHWAIRVQHKPFIIWIWLGAVLMALGGMIASLDRRYRKDKS